MSESYDVEVMPPSVAVARFCMWAQAILGLVGVSLLVALLGGALPVAQAGLLVAGLAVPLATLLLIAFLALRMRSRRGWVRTAGLVVELLMTLLGLWQLVGDVTVGNLLGVLTAGAVFGLLCRQSSATWFDR
ncbi:hypothetical protein [Nonomuraea aridisoli]|uniref:Uncharacterized protein n=1 Tax=Nonomuraea aridisoli TaxID=2070368 RepID=A0A2W2EDQ2_9ACTN|nr:hypothetical protein [Nonomuraea aridisoli]PZG22342.1 hypothetical protein C1J01_03920 [Nonomuraea aridisoli]